MTTMLPASVSVAIAAYNGEWFLPAQLDSIAAQTLRPSEIVVSDDGSSDGTVACVRAFSERTTIPVRVVRNARQRGVIGNFLHAFDQCHGDWIAYCDQDDVWSPLKLESCAVAMACDDASLVFHDSLIADAQLRPTGARDVRPLPSGRFPFPHFPDRVWAYGHQMIFSRSTLGVLRDVHRCETTEIVHLATCFDEALLVSAGLVGDIHYVPGALTTFRRHASSVSDAAKLSTSAAAEGDRRLQRIESRIRLLIELGDAVAHGAVRSRDAPASVRHLAWLLRRERLRLGAYSGSTQSRRWKSLLQAASIGAYGTLRRNALPPRQFAIDLLRAAGMRAT